MAWPDEPHAREELDAQIRCEAFDLLRAATLPADGDDELAASRAAVSNRLTDSEITTKAREITEALLASDLTLLNGDVLGGVQLYNAGKVTDAVKEAAQRATTDISAMQAAGTRRADKTHRFTIDAHSEQGRRSQMEDRHIAIPDLNPLYGFDEAEFGPQSFFAVYDGHGGVDAAKFTQAHLHHMICTHKDFKTSIKSGLHEAFLETDKAFLRKADREALSCGATAVTVLIRGSKMYVAWLGDSQAVMMHGNGVCELLMQPHKPSDEAEKKRIEAADGVVVWYGAWRVNGVLSVARAIGDKKLKQWVIGTPDVREFDLDVTDKFIVLACDGLFDVMDAAAIGEFVTEYMASNPDTPTSGCAAAMIEYAIEEKSSTDNISVIIVFFDSAAQGGSGATTDAASAAAAAAAP